MRREAPEIARKAAGPRRPRGRPKGIVWREVERWAARGAALEDIVTALAIPAAAAEQFRDRLEAAVGLGHAKFRLDLARRAHREGVLKGRPTVLLAACKKWLAYGDVPADAPPVEAGLSEQLVDALERAAAAQKERAKGASS